jgi:glycosyltransferase involved in cell wall biosynthesis
MVPYYSNIDFLRSAVASVLAQTDRDWFCVVVDDSMGGTQPAQLVAQQQDERVSYVRNERNLGVAGNFERCFELAVHHGATFVTLLHADDTLNADYIDCMRAAHTHQPQAACVAPRVTVIDAEGRAHTTLPDMVKRMLTPRRLDVLAGERGLRMLLRGQFFYCPAVSYRLSEMTLPAWDPRWRQVMDLDLYARLLLEDRTIALERRSVYRYRRHPGTMTEANSESLVRSEEEAVLCREVAARAHARGWTSAARTGRRRVTIRLQASLRMLALARRRRWSAARRAWHLAVAAGR